MTMRLTAETTESDLMVPVAMARAALLDLASTYTEGQPKWADSEHLLSAVHAVWEAEAIARAQHTIVGCLQGIEGQGDDYRASQLLKTFVHILEVGADDGWSGRKNDARRAAHEGVRKMIADLRWSLVPAVSPDNVPAIQEVRP